MSKVHTPTLLNNGFRLFQTWDGRVETPEGQIRNALLGFSEMDMTEDEVEKAVIAKPAYRDLLKRSTGRTEFPF